VLKGDATAFLTRLLAEDRWRILKAAPLPPAL
jgi:hypothetical protein